MIATRRPLQPRWETGYPAPKKTKYMADSIFIGKGEDHSQALVLKRKPPRPDYRRHRHRQGSGRNLSQQPQA